MLMFPGLLKGLRLLEVILFWLCVQCGYIIFGKHVVAFSGRTSTSTQVLGTMEIHNCLLNTAKEDSRGVTCKQ